MEDESFSRDWWWRLPRAVGETLNDVLAQLRRPAQLREAEKGEEETAKLRGANDETAETKTSQLETSAMDRT